MKKSLIALAVAGVVSAPAFAATSNVDVYGIMNIAVQDADNVAAATGVKSDGTPTVLSNTSRIGFKGSEDLGGGLKALWQIETGLDGNGTDVGTGGANGTRNTFVGLAGDFGTMVMGRHDTPYKLGTSSLDIFGDTIADYNLGRADGVELLMNAHDARVANALAYISPTWSGFHFAAAVVMANEAALPKDNIDAISLTGVYVNGPLFGSLSYQNVKDVVAAGDDSKAVKLGLGYTMGDAKVGFIYEKVSADTTAKDRKTYLINGAYNMGPVALKAQYGKVSDSRFAAGTDQSMWALGADYGLSKRTTAYFVYASADSDVTMGALVLPGATLGATNSSGTSGWNLGVKHSF
jgi:predicted porin